MNLPFLEDIDPQLLITVMAGLSALVSVLAVWSTLIDRNHAAIRARALAGHRRAANTSAQRSRKRGQIIPVSLMRRVVERFDLLRSRHAQKATLKLAGAGWRSKEALIRYFFFKLTLPFACGGATLLLMNELEATQRLLLAAAALGLGYYAPDLFVRNRTGKRQHKLRRSLPDALDLMVICAEAGLSLDATLHRVAEEMAESAPELADEVALTAMELSFLPSRVQALNGLRDRAPIPAMRAVTGTLLQAERYGTPLARSLRVLAAESREERILKAEERGARLPALLTIPMVFLILPPLFIVMMGPAVLDILDNLIAL
jgi:tight adherence protein C